MSSLPPLCPKSRWRTESSQLSTDAGCCLLHVYICSKKLSPYNVHSCILKPCWRHQGDSYEFANCLFLNRKKERGVLTAVCLSHCICLTPHIAFYRHMHSRSVTVPYFKHGGMCLRHVCCCTVCNPQNSCA